MSRPPSAGPGDSPFPRRSRRAGGDRTRFTLDLARSQHRFLKQFALDLETDASVVIRALLRLLEEDSSLAERVVARVSETEAVEQ